MDQAPKEDGEIQPHVIKDIFEAAKKGEKHELVTYLSERLSERLTARTGEKKGNLLHGIRREPLPERVGYIAEILYIHFCKVMKYTREKNAAYLEMQDFGARTQAMTHVELEKEIPLEKGTHRLEGVDLRHAGDRIKKAITAEFEKLRDRMMEKARVKGLKTTLEIGQRWLLFQRDAKVVYKRAFPTFEG